MADFQLPPDRTHAVDAPTKITPAGRRAPGPGDAGGLLRLQSTAGNHAVQRLISGKVNAAAVTIQRYTPAGDAETRELNDLIRRNWISQADRALLARSTRPSTTRPSRGRAMRRREPMQPRRSSPPGERR